MALTPAESTGSLQDSFWLGKSQNHGVTSRACQESNKAWDYLSISSQTALKHCTGWRIIEQANAHIYMSYTQLSKREWSHESLASAVS